MTEPTAAALNNTLEIAPALANVNFDFSLWKVQGKSFLGLPGYSFFGLTHCGRFIGVMGSEDEQIQLLREVARDVQANAGFENHHLIIRYKHRYQDSSNFFSEYATALPLLRNSIKRDAHGRSSLVDLAHPAERDTAKLFVLFEEGRIDHIVLVR